MEIVGVDPGLVHTGAVLIRPLAHVRAIEIMHEAIAGPDAQALEDWLARTSLHQRPWTPGRGPMMFIEGYRQRSNYGTNDKMIEAVMNFKKKFPFSRVMQNTGVKQVVRRPLMELLGVWSFSTPTHHQDLRSAARIGVYGALKSEVLNDLLFNIVNDHLAGRTWDVRHI